MLRRKCPIVAAVATLLISATSADARPAPLSSAFTYQGELRLNGANVNATADFQFTLWDALSGPNQVAGPVAVSNVTIANGLFTVPIDFGAAAFNGDARWLEIAVRSPAGSGPFTPLSPRQPLTAVPYSLQTRGIFVDNSGKVGIGTATPNRRLDISGGLGVFDALNQGISFNSDSLSFASAGNEDYVYQYLYPADAHFFSTAGSPRLTINADGNVGIGESIPTQMLHVVGNVKVQGWIGTDIDEPATIFANNKRIWRAVDASNKFGDTSPNILAGSVDNNIFSDVLGGTISGGGDESYGPNTVTDYFGTIGGGVGNTVGDAASTVDSAIGATIAGGLNNAAFGNYATVAGGYANHAGIGGFIGGGSGNLTIGFGAAIAAGFSNAADGYASAVPGGELNSAAGNYSFAAGNRAKANHNGAFVWGDTSNSNVTSSAEDQFTARAAGGVRFFTNSSSSLGAKLDANATAWSVICDRNAKRDITPINPREIVHRLAAIPISTWTYKDDASATPHMGPMAQDFHAAFGLGSDDKSITTLDADGVALAAIQGLHQLVKDKDAEIADLRDRLAALEAAFNKERSQ